MDINFFFSESFQSNKTSDVIIISDVKENFTSKFESLACMAGIISKDDIVFIESVATARLTAAAETTSSVELFIRGDTAANPPRRIILALLPSNYSRHNTPSRSHSVASLIKANKGSSKNLTVILRPSDNDYLFPQAIAVARQFPSYYLKKSTNAENEVMNLNVVLHSSLGKSDSFLLLKLANISKGIHLAQRLVDAPPNVLHTDAYVEECVAVANRLGCEIKVSN